MAHVSSPQIEPDLLSRDLASLSRLEQRIGLIARVVPGRIAFSTSLGSEDQAILHAIASSGTAIDVFTLDTGRHFPETLETIERSEHRYGLRIRVIAPASDHIEALVARHGINGFRWSIEARKACCDARKVKPLQRALAGAAGWLTGLRRAQSDERHATRFAERDPALDLLKLNPLADWSLEQLEAYVTENDIPINPLHARGYPSIGCQPCTRAVRPGEDVRAGQWWWENEDGKECGLHNTPIAGGPRA